MGVKLSDRFTHGVPDFFYVNSANTVWIEVKQMVTRSANYPVLDLKIGPQLMMMLEFEQHNVPAAYFIYLDGPVAKWKPKGVIEHYNAHHVWCTVWKPSKVHEAISGKISISMEPGPADVAFEQFKTRGYAMLYTKKHYDPIFEFLDMLGRV